MTFEQSSATKILTQGDGRKWGDHKGHKSSLRHTSSRVWFTQTIDTTTTSGHSHICLSCGSQFAEAKKSSGLITVLSKRHRGLAVAEKASVFAFILRLAGLGFSPVWNVKLPQLCLSDVIYLAAAVWDESFTQSWVTFGGSPPTYCTGWGTETSGLRSLVFFLLKDPQCDCDPVRMLCGLVPRWDDWARLSLTHCETFPVRLPRTAFTHQLSLNTRPCAQMGNAATHKKKPPAVTRFLYASIYLLHKYDHRIPQ